MRIHDKKAQHGTVTDVSSSNSSVCQQRSVDHLLVTRHVVRSRGQNDQRATWLWFCYRQQKHRTFPSIASFASRPSGSDSWEKMKTCFQRPEPLIKQRHELAGLFHTVTLSAAGCRAGVAWGRWQDPGVKALIGAHFSTNVPTRSVSRAADTDKRVCRQSSHVSETTSTLLVLRRPVR